MILKVPLQPQLAGGVWSVIITRVTNEPSDEVISDRQQQGNWTLGVILSAVRVMRWMKNGWVLLRCTPMILLSCLLSPCSGVPVLSLGHLQDSDGPVLAGGCADGGLRLLLY